jgi:hypothetical protein
MNAKLQNAGASMQVRKGVVPTNAGAGAINGTGLDRTGFLSAVLALFVGAASGTPTSYTVDCKLQDSADNSSFTDVTGGSVTQVTADNGTAHVDVDLSNLRQYVRAVVTVGITGGTSPKVPVSATLVLAGPTTVPVTTY